MGRPEGLVVGGIGRESGIGEADGWADAASSPVADVELVAGCSDSTEEGAVVVVEPGAVASI